MPPGSCSPTLLVAWPGFTKDATATTISIIINIVVINININMAISIYAVAGGLAIIPPMLSSLKTSLQLDQAMIKLTAVASVLGPFRAL